MEVSSVLSGWLFVLPASRLGAGYRKTLRYGGEATGVPVWVDTGWRGKPSPSTRGWRSRESWGSVEPTLLGKQEVGESHWQGWSLTGSRGASQPRYQSWAEGQGSEPAQCCPNWFSQDGRLRVGQTNMNWWPKTQIKCSNSAGGDRQGASREAPRVDTAASRGQGQRPPPLHSLFHMNHPVFSSHTHTHKQKTTHTHTHTHTKSHTHTQTQNHTYIQTHMYSHTQNRTHIHTHTHTQNHTHTKPHTHT